MWWEYPNIPFEVLKGKTLTKIEGMEAGNNEIRFHCTDGSMYIMYHEQDCCESVTIDDVYGDVEDLIGSPILIAEENTNVDAPAKDSVWDNSYTWTFYKLATQKGYVDIKWYGVSNGYYSERVDFRDITPKKES